MSAVLTGAAVASLLGSHSAHAQSWTGGGADDNWLDSANWTAAAPNAPGAAANLNVPLGGNLSPYVPSPVTIGSLTMGASDGAFTTDIVATGSGSLTFVPDGTLSSAGAAGAVNRISAPVFLGDAGSDVGPVAPTTPVTLVIDGTNGFTFAGPFTVNRDARTSGAASVDRRIMNNLPAGATLTFNALNLSQAGAVGTGGLWIRGNGTTIFNGPISNGPLALGTALILGESTPLTGAQLATTSGATFEFMTDSTHDRHVTWNRSTAILHTSNPFGSNASELRPGNPSQATGFNLVSAVDNLVLNNPIRVQQAVTVRGSNSITLAGWAALTTNDRPLVNLLPASETLTGTGPIYCAITGDSGRRFVFDGEGTTTWNGNIYNHAENAVEPGPASLQNTADAIDDNSSTGSVFKRGTGVLVLGGTTSTYRGRSVAEGGLMLFNTNVAFGNTSHVELVAGGAAGVLSGGTLNATFLGKIAGPTAGNDSNQNTLFESAGALALTTADAGTNIDYTTGSLADPDAVGVGIGAVHTGVTYTGAITPDATRGYRLGGGGKLTINATGAALAGANNVTLSNGGTVALLRDNTYSGNTLVGGAWINASQEQARVNGGLNYDGLSTSTSNPGTTANLRVNSTLEVHHLDDATAASSIGNVADTAASRLVFNGGTLRFVGAAGDGDTNRLFTVGPNGATLDASGAGVMQFTNPADLATYDAAADTGNTSSNTRQISNLGPEVIHDLAPGMTIANANFPGGTAKILAIEPWNGNGRISVDQLATATQSGSALTFQNQSRAITLTGANTGDNLIASGIGDPATGSTSVLKTGGGTWRLSGAMHYSGATTVTAGKLRLSTDLTSGTRVEVNGAGATLELTPAKTRVIRTPQLAIIAGGRLDLTDNKLIVANGDVGTWTGSAYTGVTGLIRSGRASGNWSGSGIVTSQTDATIGSLTGIGIASAAEVKGIATTATAAWAGQTVTGSDTLVMYTYGGDANLDGLINIDDYGHIDTSVGIGLTGWFNGDFNYDGQINIDDYGIIDVNIGIQGTPFSTSSEPLGGFTTQPSPTAVPEPTAWFSLLLAPLLRRHRRARSLQQLVVR